MAIKKQYYSIKFPFTANSTQKYYFDLNENKEQMVRSQMMHVIFTPKGSKLRDPEFGTNLLHYLFEPSFSDTWGSVKSEISSAVSKYIPEMKINDISIMQDEENYHRVYVRIDYTVKDGNKVTTDSIVTQV